MRPSSGCARITITQPDDLVAKELLFDAFFQKRDWAPALVLAEQLVARAAGHRAPAEGR